MSTVRMSTRHENMTSKADIRSLLKDSILKLCAISVPQGLGIEVDGIICISLPGEDLGQIVVKVHETLDRRRTDELLGVGSLGQASQPGIAGSPPTPLTEATTCLPSHCEQLLPQDRQAGSQSNGRHTPTQNGLDDNKGPLLEPEGPTGAKGPAAGAFQVKTEQSETLLIQESVHDMIRESVRDSVRSHMQAVDLSNAGVTEFPCMYCQLVLPSHKALQQHWKKIHKAIVCSQCHVPFIKQTSYLQHLETHANEIPAKRGPGRPKGSLSKSPKFGKVALHDLKNRGTILESKCGVCGDMLPQDMIIKHMIDYHFLEHCFTCQQCVEYFPNRQSLVIHRRLNHSNVTDVKCSVCEVAFYNWEITNHMRECTDSGVNDENGNDSPLKRPRSNSPSSEEESTSKRQKSDTLVITPIQDDEGEENGNTEDLQQTMKMEKDPDTPALDLVKAAFARSESDLYRSDIPLDVSLMENSRYSPDQEDDDSSGSFCHTKTNFEDGLPVFYKQTGVTNAPPIPPALGPFRCSLCDKLTMNIREFGKHNYDHHYRYTCPFCAQTFATKRNVRRHMRKHTGDRPYTCDMCEQTFYRNDDLRRHRVHVHEKMYNCSYCQISHRLYTKVEIEDHLHFQHKFLRANITDEEIAHHLHSKAIPE